MKPLISVTILLVLFLPVSDQVADNLEVFDPVPANQRAHLNERLRLLIEYQRTKQYDRLFEMLPKIHTQHPELTKEKFLAQIRIQAKLTSLISVPNTQVRIQQLDGEYAIHGCANVREGWGKRKWQGAIYASLENGEWYFSDILFTFSNLHARNPAPCTSKKKR